MAGEKNEYFSKESKTIAPNLGTWSEKCAATVKLNSKTENFIAEIVGSN